ncbi:MAG: phosphoribosylanthranilate isomerase [Gallionella sp.]
MTRIKICGLTRAEDITATVRGGADAIGLVFYEKSPRHVTLQKAVELAGTVPPFVSIVGLFVNAEPDFVNEILQSVPLDLLQFHGDETPEYCRQFNKPYIKAIRVKAGVDLLQCSSDFIGAKGLLLDAHVEGIPGGTGATFDWTLIPRKLSLPVILSGGLDTQNLALAIEQVCPYAVDVSSGVEENKGIKDAKKVAAFINEVNRIDVQLSR